MRECAQTWRFDAVRGEVNTQVTTATLWIPAIILGILMLVFVIYYISS